eukprot:2335973-Rhodomonas_salina.2
MPRVAAALVMEGARGATEGELELGVARDADASELVVNFAIRDALNLGGAEVWVAKVRAGEWCALHAESHGDVC